MPNATIAEDPRLPRPKEVEATARIPSSGAKAVPARASEVEALPPRSKPKLEIAKPNGVPTLRQFGRVSARSAAMHDVFEVLDRFVSTDVSITLVGETGAGKDVLAHAVHEQSPRAGGPLVVFDCGAVAANLAESELLGHERGAFTGAVTGHAGAFERAHGGTLFLDEIAELPLDLQSRLLRALESRKVRRVGGRLDRRVDVRVIAATNRDLRADVAAGRFREDLFFRLAVAVVPVPPLRKRTEDLPELTRGLLNDLGRPEIRLSEAAEALLRAHAWPGNVRELKNALSCATAFVDPGETVLDTHHLRLLGGGQGDGAWVDELPLAGQALERIERAAIRQTMSLVKGNKMEAARVLGIAPSTLYEKLKKYAL
jgi:transcriptional regulator with PAS, ATPase and Fis domain